MCVLAAIVPGPVLPAGGPDGHLLAVAGLPVLQPQLQPVGPRDGPLRQPPPGHLRRQLLLHHPPHQHGRRTR